MSERSSNPSPAPGLVLLLGPLLGIVAGAGVYLSRQALRPHLSVPWDDLLQPPWLIGLACFVAALVMILLEAVAVLFSSGAVTRLDLGDDTSWAGQARRRALTSLSARPYKQQRLDNLRAYHAALRSEFDLRWLFYALLALGPAIGGLVIGLRGLKVAEGRALPFLDLFAPLVAGSVLGAALWIIGGVVRRRGSALLRRWLTRCEELETPRPKPAAPPEQAVPTVKATIPTGRVSPNGADSEHAEKPKDGPGRRPTYES